jgi:hypothetical protein
MSAAFILRRSSAFVHYGETGRPPLQHVLYAFNLEIHAACRHRQFDIMRKEK